MGAGRAAARAQRSRPISENKIKNSVKPIIPDILVAQSECQYRARPGGALPWAAGLHSAGAAMAIT
jgi:hypothetical protein